MSLLMDALRKAEAAKRQTAQGEHAATSESAPAQPAEPGNSLPELPRELSLLDEQFAAPHSAPSVAGRSVTGAAASVSETQRDREAAHNLFAAKRSSSRAPFWIGLTASTLTAVAAIGYWFWWQLQPPSTALKPGPALAQVSATPTPPAKPAPAADAKIPQTPPLAVAPLSAPPGAGGISPRPTARPVPDQSRTGFQAGPSVKRPADPTRAGAFAAQPEPSDTVIPGEPRVRRGTSPREQINPAVARGYAAYTAGDMTGAKRHYEDALRGDPRSLDALNGMTAVALRSGRRDLAETYLARALEVDPRDTYALSVLASLKGQSDPQAAESRLRGLISAAPDSPAAHFGLGNLYARDGRWAEAQQAYFRAFSSEPDNPDYLFNLAVSLDHLRQSKLALQYYHGALAATRPGAFDRELVAARMRDLQQLQ